MNVKCNVKKSVGIIFSGILFLPLFAFFAFFDVRTISDSPIINNDVVYYFLKAVMVFALVFFGFGLLIIFRNLIRYRDNIIEIKEDYLIDRSSYIAGGKIYYKDIDCVYIKGMFLCIKLKNELEVLNKANWLKKIFMVSNKKMKYEYITISDNLLDTDIYQIKMLLEEKINNI